MAKSSITPPAPAPAAPSAKPSRGRRREAGGGGKTAGTVQFVLRCLLGGSVFSLVALVQLEIMVVKMDMKKASDLLEQIDAPNLNLSSVNPWELMQHGQGRRAEVEKLPLPKRITNLFVKKAEGGAEGDYEEGEEVTLFGTKYRLRKEKEAKEKEEAKENEAKEAKEEEKEGGEEKEKGRKALSDGEKRKTRLEGEEPEVPSGKLRGKAGKNKGGAAGQGARTGAKKPKPSTGDAKKAAKKASKKASKKAAKKAPARTEEGGGDAPLGEDGSGVAGERTYADVCARLAELVRERRALVEAGGSAEIADPEISRLEETRGGMDVGGEADPTRISETIGLLVREKMDRIAARMDRRGVNAEIERLRRLRDERVERGAGGSAQSKRGEGMTVVTA